MQRIPMCKVWEEVHNVEQTGTVAPLLRTIVCQDCEVGKILRARAKKYLGPRQTIPDNCQGSAQNRTSGTLSHGLVFVFMVGVKARDSGEGCGRLGGLREIFVALEANRDSDLRFPLRN